MKKILIIDDDKDIVEIVTYILTKRNYKVESTLDKDIFATIKQFEPDLVLIDLLLKGIGDGREICRQIKANYTCTALIFSALNNVTKIYKDCNADGYVPKPFEIDELISIIESHLKNTVAKQ